MELAGNGDATPITIRVADNARASTALAVLEALGFAVTRELDGDADADQLTWAIGSAVMRSNLTGRESTILGLVVRHGMTTNEAIADQLSLSRRTVKWHMHNIFTKTGTTSHVELLRHVLGLSSEPPARAIPATPRASAEEIARPSKSWF
jgi:DNA-binding CsgD family transcriptional regulator